MSNLFDYSQTPGSNNSAPPDGAPEGQAPSSVNNVIRQMMANMVGAFTAYSAGGTADAQTVTMDPALSAYSTAVRVAFIPVANNTGACTLDVNGLGAKSIKMLDGADPPAGALNTSGVAVAQYDGTNFVLLSAANLVTTSGTQTLTNKTISASQITEISNLTAAEGAQLENINSVTITNTQWGYVGGADQPNTTTDTPTFDGAILTDAPQIDMPVSTTSSGGTAGIDYDVADWPGTLVSGRTYYFRAHSTNIARPSIEGMSVVYPGGDIVPPNTIRSGGIYGVRVSGSTLVITNPSLNIESHSIATVSGGDSWTRVCRITASTGARCSIKLRFTRNDGANEIMDAYVAVKEADDRVDIVTKVIGDNSLMKHNRVAAYFSGTDQVDIYFSSGGSGSSLFNYIPEIIEYLSTSIQIQFFDDQPSDTEANITGGTFDVTSQAAGGEIIEDKSVSLGGSFSDSVRLVVTKTKSGKNVFISADGSFSHSSSSTPASSSGVIDAAYRPSSGVSQVYEIDPGSGPNAVYRVEVAFDGDVSFRYLDWAGAPTSKTSTGAGWSIQYWVSD